MIEGLLWVFRDTFNNILVILLICGQIFLIQETTVPEEKL